MMDIRYIRRIQLSGSLERIYTRSRVTMLKYGNNIARQAVLYFTGCFVIVIAFSQARAGCFTRRFCSRVQNSAHPVTSRRPSDTRNQMRHRETDNYVAVDKGWPLPRNLQSYCRRVPWTCQTDCGWCNTCHHEIVQRTWCARKERTGCANRADERCSSYCRQYALATLSYFVDPLNWRRLFSRVTSAPASRASSSFRPSSSFMSVVRIHARALPTWDETFTLATFLWQCDYKENALQQCVYNICRFNRIRTL